MPRSCANSGDFDGAIEDLRELIAKKGPTQERAQTHSGSSRLRCQRWDDAAATFRQSLELPGIKGICQANLGMALLRGGKPDEALPELQEAMRIVPQVPALLSMVGVHTATRWPRWAATMRPNRLSSVQRSLHKS